MKPIFLTNTNRQKIEQPQHINHINNTMNNDTTKIIRIDGLSPVIEKYNEIIKTKKVLLILDIDDVTLSSKIGQKLVDEKIKKLVDISFDNGLLFLTARCKSMQSYTMNQLNRAGLIHRGEYIKYKIIFSPEDEDGTITKGHSAIKYLHGTDYNYVIFVDDLYPNCEDVKTNLSGDNIEFTIYHFVRQI